MFLHRGTNKHTALHEMSKDIYIYIYIFIHTYKQTYIHIYIQVRRHRAERRRALCNRRVVCGGHCPRLRRAGRTSVSAPRRHMGAHDLLLRRCLCRLLHRHHHPPTRHRLADCAAVAGECAGAHPRNSHHVLHRCLNPTPETKLFSPCAHTLGTVISSYTGT